MKVNGSRDVPTPPCEYPYEEGSGGDQRTRNSYPALAIWSLIQ